MKSILRKEYTVTLVFIDGHPDAEVNGQPLGSREEIRSVTLE
jgi:hypothetical protein